MKGRVWALLMMSILSLSSLAGAKEKQIEVGAPAPQFSAQTDQDRAFQLADRKGLWTVLYFYPKDDTPGCTKEACAFRDRIHLIRELNADVFGVSKDSVKSHAKFRDKHKLNFTLLADPQGDIIKAFGAAGLTSYAKRWTFIIGPDLYVRWMQKDVDPVAHADEIANVLKELQKKENGNGQ